MSTASSEATSMASSVSGSDGEVFICEKNWPEPLLDRKRLPGLQQRFQRGQHQGPAFHGSLVRCRFAIELIVDNPQLGHVGSSSGELVRDTRRRILRDCLVPVGAPSQGESLVWLNLENLTVHDFEAVANKGVRRPLLESALQA